MMDQQSFNKATPGKKVSLDLTNYGYAKSTPNRENRSLCDSVLKSLPSCEAAATVSLNACSVRTPAPYRAA